MNESLRYASASGADLARVTQKMLSGVEGETKDHVAMAAISIVLFLQYPKINAEQLIAGIKTVSEHASLFCSTLDNPLDKSKVN